MPGHQQRTVVNGLLRCGAVLDNHLVDERPECGQSRDRSQSRQHDRRQQGGEIHRVQLRAIALAQP